MNTMARFTLALLALAASANSVLASDRTGIYAVVDKVVLEPNPEAPERIQVWGVFAVAKKDDRDLYQEPVRGYLYFRIKPREEELARREWADLKSVAGQGKPVGFGFRYQLDVRVRKQGERPENPDSYPLSTGMALMRTITEYGPIRALLDFAGR